MQQRHEDEIEEQKTRHGYRSTQAFLPPADHKSNNDAHRKEGKSQPNSRLDLRDIEWLSKKEEKQNG